MDFSTLENKVLAGRFRLSEELGRGGFGAVFRAEQISMGRPCAVKLLSASSAFSEEETAARFEQEARATSLLTHPNTITIFDFGTDDETGLLFLAMEFLQGKSLADHLKQEGPIGLRRSIRMVNQIAGSLAEAHQSNIVHRDIKPANVMLVTRDDDPMFVKVIDFGIAKAFASEESDDDDENDRQAQLTQTGTIIGTPSYMSPEQIDQKPLNGRSDQYALACMFYTMMSGKPPYYGGSPMGIATRHLSDTPEPLSKRVDVPEEIDRILLKALSKNPDARFDDIRAFAKALSKAINLTSPFEAVNVPGEVTQPRKGAAEHSKTTEVMGSQKGLLIAAVLLVVVGVLAIAAVLVSKNQTPEEETPEIVVVEPTSDPVPAEIENTVEKEEPEKTIAELEVPEPELPEPVEEKLEPEEKVQEKKKSAKKTRPKKTPKKTTAAAKKSEPAEKEIEPKEKTAVTKAPEPTKVKTPEEKKPVEPKTEPKKPNVMWGME